MPISKKKYLLYIGAGLFLLICVLSLLPDQVSLAESAGYALEFDGSNDYVRFASTVDMFPPGWQDTKTVSLWVRPDGPGAVCIEVAHCDHIFGDFPRWWGISRGTIGSQDRIWIWNQSDGTTKSIGFPYTPGVWVHVALVHSAGMLRAYKNGEEVASIASGTTLQPPANPVLQIGGILKNYETRWVFRGEIDELRLWSIARSTAEIQQDMFHELLGSESGLVAYYQMSDGSGLTLTDNSGNGWTGTLYDGNLYFPADGHPPTWVLSTAFDGQPSPTATPTPTSLPPTPTATFTLEPPTATPSQTALPPTSTPTSTATLPTSTPTNTQPHPSETPDPTASPGLDPTPYVSETPTIPQDQYLFYLPLDVHNYIPGFIGR